MEQSELLVYIEGGNRQNGYGSELVVQGVAKDLDEQVAQQELGITLAWTCEDLMNGGEQCRNIKNELITLNQTSKSQSFEAKILQPYSTLRFYLTGDKAAANKTTKDEAIIMIVELDIEPLQIKFPDNIYVSKINKNDDLQIDVTYGNNPDDYSLFLIIFYKLDIVATKKQNFTSFAFQVWDLFSEFETDSNEILVRVSLYDPKFFMPSISTVKVLVNFEPSLGEILVSPASGVSLDTLFTIQASGFYDEDTPLSYRFFLYAQESLYDEERELGVNPVNSKRDFLRDTQYLNTFSGRLSRGVQNSNPALSYRVLVLVSIIDSLGAVTNQTKAIRVTPKYPSNAQVDQQLLHYTQFYQNNIQSNTILSDRVANLNLITAEVLQLDSSPCSLNSCNSRGNCSAQTQTCTCEEGFYLRDCSLSESQYAEFKQLKYSLLQGLQSVDQSQLDALTQNQIQKSIFSILQQQDLFDLMSDSEVQSTIAAIDSVVQKIYSEIDTIIQNGQLNQGVNVVSQKIQQFNLILGKNLETLDGLMGTVSKKISK